RLCRVALHAAAFAVSMSSVYLPKRALLLHQERWWNACCASATFAGSPFQALSTGACKARPNEKLSCHGKSLRRFIALRCSVACESVWPPERNTRPGTATGTTRFMQRTVASATSSTDACCGHSFPESTMFGLSNISSNTTRCSPSASKTLRSVCSVTSKCRSIVCAPSMSTSGSTKVRPSLVFCRIVSSKRLTPLMKSPAPFVVNKTSRYARRFSSVDATLMLFNRFSIVPELSSAARIPLPGATSFFATDSKFSFFIILSNHFRCSQQLQLTYWSQPRKLSRLSKGLLLRVTQTSRPCNRDHIP